MPYSGGTVAAAVPFRICLNVSPVVRCVSYAFVQYKPGEFFAKPNIPYLESGYEETTMVPAFLAGIIQVMAVVPCVLTSVYSSRSGYAPLSTGSAPPRDILQSVH